MDFTNFWIMMAIIIMVSAAFALGRVVQYMRQTDERDQAYRTGYGAGHENALRTMPRVLAQLHGAAPGPSTGRHGGGPGQERLTTTDVIKRWRPDRTVAEGTR